MIRRAYGKHMRFPFGLVKLRQMARQVQDSILCNYRESHVKEDALKVQLVNDAKECLNNMSNLLGVNVFMFENQYAKNYRPKLNFQYYDVLFLFQAKFN